MQWIFKDKLLGPAIESYIDRLDPSTEGWDVYKSSAEKALEQFNKTFKVEKIDKLNIPAWAEFDSYYVSLKYFPYAEQEKICMKCWIKFLIRYLMGLIMPLSGVKIIVK